MTVKILLITQIILDTEKKKIIIKKVKKYLFMQNIDCTQNI